MKTVGLIGHPLTHSFSKPYFDNKFREEKLMDVSFQLFDIDNINKLPQILNNKSLKGFAVTIPYKQSIVKYLHQKNSIVNEVNACNCIAINNGNLIGYNTDVLGFEQSLLQSIKPYHTSALILGNGGAAQSVKYVLNKLNIKFKIITRKGLNNTISYQNISEDLIVNNLLIVNTTPLGTFPNTNSYPNIPFNFIGSKHFLFDLVYNPSITQFMQKGMQQNALVKNGYQMLCLQAEENWKIWNS